jgi:hypothetical protein
LIARQRDNLRRTFDLAEATTAGTPNTQRITRNEQELLDATTEFTEGIEAIAGPVPCLHEAQDAMRDAVGALGQKDLRSGGGAEETALSNLIKARQNLRKFLARQSSSASACRKFDKQQKQKLRKPKDDKKERLAKLQQEIEELAKEEKKFSEEVAPKSGGGPEMEQDPSAQQKPQSAKSKQGSPSSGSSSAGERQEKAAAKAAELQKLV